MLSISLGLIPAIPFINISSNCPDLISELLGISATLSCMGTPSITHKGCPSPVIVLVPLIRIFCVLPGCPVTADTATPAILPCIKASTVGWA